MVDINNIISNLKNPELIKELLTQGLQYAINELLFDNFGSIALLEGVPIHINGYNYNKNFQTSEYKFSNTSTGIVNVHTRELPAVINLSDCYFSRDTVGFFVEKVRKEPNIILELFSYLQKTGNTLMFISPDFSGEVFIQNYNITRTNQDKVYFNISLKTATNVIENNYDSLLSILTVNTNTAKESIKMDLSDLNISNTNTKSLIDTNLTIQSNIKNYNKVQFFELDINKEEGEESNLFNNIIIPVDGAELLIYYTIFEDTITLHYPNKFLLGIDENTPNKIGIYYEDDREYYIIFNKFSEDKKVICNKNSIFNIYKIGVLINE